MDSKEGQSSRAKSNGQEVTEREKADRLGASKTKGTERWSREAENKQTTGREREKTGRKGGIAAHQQRTKTGL